MGRAVLSFAPASPVPVLLAGVRDEFVARTWRPPARHWPDRPALIGGRDAQAGGTWLAVDPDAPRAATVLNGRGTMAPQRARTSRGDLPLRAAADGEIGGIQPPPFSPLPPVPAAPAPPPPGGAGRPGAAGARSDFSQDPAPPGAWPPLPEPADAPGGAPGVVPPAHR